MAEQEKELVACGKCEWLVEIRTSRVNYALNQFCGANPNKDRFNFFSGEFEPPAAAEAKYRLCVEININGHCPKYEEKKDED